VCTHISTIAKNFVKIDMLVPQLAGLQEIILKLEIRGKA